MSKDEILEQLERVFTNDKFTITKKYKIYSISTKTTQQRCLKLWFRGDHVEIDNLDKCGIQGSESIRMVEEALKKIPSAQKIKLYDGSNILVCGERINLACLKILSKGESWYNSLGYYSETKDWEKEENAKIIENPFQQFLDDSLGEEFAKLKTDIVTNGSKWFPGTNLTDTTKDYFTKINAIILSDKDVIDCSEEKKTKYIWLSEFFYKILVERHILKYNGNLSKNIEPLKLTAGKKSKKYRKKTKKRRNISRSKQ
jgi:hypothetical protein